MNISHDTKTKIIPQEIVCDKILKETTNLLMEI